MQVFLVIVAFMLISVGLVWYFVSQDRGEREPLRALWLAAGLGLAGGIAAAIIEDFLIPANNLTKDAGFTHIMVATLAVGLIEEVCKFVPLALVIYHKRYFNEHTDGIIYFALAGLGFGLPENILYTLNYGAATGLRRMLLTPFFHAAITGAIGFFLIKAKLDKRSPFSIAPLLIGAIVLHALYDFGLLSGRTSLAMLSAIFTFGITVMLFALYNRAGELDQMRGLSTVGNNSYCRNCGQQNKSHHLYCTRCGHRA